MTPELRSTWARNSPCAPRFVAVFLRVQIGLRFNPRLFYRPIAKRMANIVKPERVAVRVLGLLWTALDLWTAAFTVYHNVYAIVRRSGTLAFHNDSLAPLSSQDS